MAIFKYTLPSGSTFQLDAPANTTQSQADYIFYSQVAAGTFVGYKVGDRLTHPAQALENFGITRIQRGTAGINDQTILAVTVTTDANTQSQNDQIKFVNIAGPNLDNNANLVASNNISTSQSTKVVLDNNTLVKITSTLPQVVTLPDSLTSISVDPITQANFVQVSSNPLLGIVDQGPNAIGELSTTNVKSLMAASIVQPYNALTQQYGVGMYGFNAVQLERAGYIKPGYAQKYCPTPPGGPNPSNFVDFMKSPTPWAGGIYVTSVDQILNSQSIQNKIQEILMNDSYNTFVNQGLIKPTVATSTTPVASAGVVYGSNGVLTTASAVDIQNAAPKAITIPTASTVGAVPSTVSALGSDAVAEFAAGASSLSSGAAITGTTAGAVGSQLTGLAAGILGGPNAALAASLATAVTGDIGALVANASKFGPALTNAWAQGANIVGNLGSIDVSAIGDKALAGLDSLKDSAGAALTNLEGNLEGALKNAVAGPAGAAMGLLGKASQLATSIGDQFAGLVTGVQKAAAFTNTVDRSTIDAAVTRVIGSAKVSSPTYELPSPASLGITADIAQAQSILANAGAAAADLGNQAVAIAGQAQGLVATAKNTVASAQTLAVNTIKNSF